MSSIVSQVGFRAPVGKCPGTDKLALSIYAGALLAPYCVYYADHSQALTSPIWGSRSAWRGWGWCPSA